MYVLNVRCDVKTRDVYERCCLRNKICAFIVIILFDSIFYRNQHRFQAGPILVNNRSFAVPGRWCFVISELFVEHTPEKSFK